MAGEISETNGLAADKFLAVHPPNKCDVVRVRTPISNPPTDEAPWEGICTLPVYRLTCKTHNVESSLFYYVAGTRYTFVE